MWTEQAAVTTEEIDSAVLYTPRVDLAGDGPTEPELGQPFTGRLTRLHQLSTVAPGTVVAVLAPNRAVQVKQPGRLLIPPWTPVRTPVNLMPVSTDPVTVQVIVHRLVTLDGQDLDRVVLDVRVRLSEREREGAGLAGLVSEHGSELGSWLEEQVQDSIESSVRAAVGLNRGVELRRQSLASALRERWLPTSFADGALDFHSFTVMEERWPADTDQDPITQPLPVVPPMESVTRPLDVRTLGSDPAHHRRRSASWALNLVYLPAIISVGTSGLFFILFWLPELGSLPGLHFVLAQLAPLAPQDSSSQSQPLGAQQRGHSSWPATWLLIVSLALAPLARSRYWAARLALWPLTYLATISALVVGLGVVVRGQLGAELVGVLLLVAWVVGALITTWRSVWVDVETLPRRPDRVLWLLGVYALLNAAPIAVGRRLFAPELRTAAATIQGNDLTLRWAALLTPGTALVYLCGLAVGAVVWAAYMLSPPRLAGHRRVPVAVLSVALLTLLTIAPQAAASAERRAETILNDSPHEEVGFSCGEYARRAVGRPARTLVVTGLGCRRLTTFSGYQELSTRELSTALSPVSVIALGGERIPGRMVAAQYGEVLAVATTDRLDHRADALLGLRLSDGAEVWRYACPPKRVLSLRFAGTGADDLTAGRLTIPGERPTVVIDCDGRSRRLDPATGRVR